MSDAHYSEQERSSENEMPICEPQYPDVAFEAFGPPLQADPHWGPYSQGWGMGYQRVLTENELIMSVIDLSERVRILESLVHNQQFAGMALLDPNLSESAEVPIAAAAAVLVEEGEEEESRALRGWRTAIAPPAEPKSKNKRRARKEKHKPAAGLKTGRSSLSETVDCEPFSMPLSAGDKIVEILERVPTGLREVVEFLKGFPEHFAEHVGQFVKRTTPRGHYSVLVYKNEIRFAHSLKVEHEVALESFLENFASGLEGAVNDCVRKCLSGTAPFGEAGSPPICFPLFFYWLLAQKYDSSCRKFVMFGPSGRHHSGEAWNCRRGMHGCLCCGSPEHTAMPRYDRLNGHSSECPTVWCLIEAFEILESLFSRAYGLLGDENYATVLLESNSPNFWSN